MVETRHSFDIAIPGDMPLVLVKKENKKEKQKMDSLPARSH